MHDIAKRFSPEARAAVREAFAEPNELTELPTGVFVEYQGRSCCALGVGLLRDRPKEMKQWIGAFSKVVEPSDYGVAIILGSISVQPAALDFISCVQSTHQKTRPLEEVRASILAAFSELDEDTSSSATQAELGKD